MNRHDALRDVASSNYGPSITDQIIRNRDALIAQLADVADSLNDPDLPWSPGQRAALRNAAQRVADAAR